MDDERERFEEFFKKFLFFDQAVFTLYGSKPITEIILYPETPEEKLIAQQRALESLSDKQRKHLLESSSEHEEEYWFEETWSMWEKKLKKLHLKHFLFAERKIGIPKELEKNRYIYFINIPETVKVLEEHYLLFKEYIGCDFNSLSVVLEANNPESFFWKAIWTEEITDKSVCLNGILFGYGLENSKPFSLFFLKPKNAEEEKKIQKTLKEGKGTVTTKALKEFSPPKKFFLPSYNSFARPDPHREKYEHEYKNIQKVYTNSDMIECTIEKLIQ